MSADSIFGAPRRVGPGWFTLFTLVWLALWTVQLTPLQLLIPLQLDTPDDAGGWISGVVASGLVLATGGLAGVIAGPLSGALSDRTRGRLGRRRPWALAGVVVASGSLTGLASAAGPWSVGIAWVGVSVGTAVASAAFTALIADQLTAQRGAASAAVSSSQALGIVVGVGVITLLGLGVATGYLVLAGFLGVVGITAALVLPDPMPPAGDRGRRAVAERLAPVRNRDLSWLLTSRLIVNIGNALGTSLLLFFLLYGLGAEPAGAEEQLLLLILIYTVFVVIASVVAGSIADRAGHKVPMSVVSAVIQAVAALVLATAPSLGSAMIAAGLLGVGYGAYMSVSLALAADLLPDAADHARDLGFVNVAANLGQLLGPLIGAGLVAAVGGFWLLFVAAGVLSLAGAAMTLAIRSPRVVAADASAHP